MYMNASEMFELVDRGVETEMVIRCVKLQGLQDKLSKKEYTHAIGRKLEQIENELGFIRKALIKLSGTD